MSNITENEAYARGTADFYAVPEGEPDMISPFEWGTPEDVSWRKAYKHEKDAWLKDYPEDYQTDNDYEEQI